LNRSHTWASAGGRAVGPPWIFKHGTNIVEIGLKVLFSAFFAIFRSFFPLLPSPFGNFLPTPLVTQTHTALKRFNKLQSYCAKNGSDRFAMIKVIAKKLVKFLIAKSLKQATCILFLESACFLLRVESFQQTIIEIKEIC